MLGCYFTGKLGTPVCSSLGLGCMGSTSNGLRTGASRSWHVGLGVGCKDLGFLLSASKTSLNLFDEAEGPERHANGSCQEPTDDMHLRCPLS